MPTHVFLANLTDQGIRAVADTTRRAQATDETIKGHGATTRDILWTQGRFDIVMTAEAPDEEAAWKDSPGAYGKARDTPALRPRRRQSAKA